VVALFVCAQLAVAAVIGVAAVIVAAFGGADVQDPAVVELISDRIMVAAVVLSLVGSGALAILVARVWFRSEVFDPNGAAWRFGNANQIALGLAAGAVIGAAYLALAAAFGPQLGTVEAGPLGRMAVTPGMQQMAWTALALVLAPPIEELVFRGVLYGGLRNSWGAAWSGVVTSLVFVMLHGTEIVRFWPAVFGVSAVAVATIWIRLRTGAIGPAVALHFAYNAALAATVAVSTL
jgi:membrane protease YdiL (CAAX protease family)